MAIRNWMRRMMQATSAAAGAFVHTYTDPARVQGGDARLQRPPFELYRAYYDNSVFDAIAIGAYPYHALGGQPAHQQGTWGQYKARYKLYRDVRSLYNPTARLCDDYASLVYPGYLSEDGTKLPDNTPIAIPLSADTPPQLKAAIAQFWRWSNWQAGKSLYVRWGAIAGSVLVEVVDDLDRRKVLANIVWPGNVADIDLDGTGNVKGYALEYSIDDDDGQTHLYRKEVDASEYRTYRDGVAFDYSENGQGAVWANPYGFVPAVWAKHRDLGGNYGRPAMSVAFQKVDSLNSLASHLDDAVHKQIEAPKLIATSGQISSLFSGAGKRDASTEYDGEGKLISTGNRETQLMLKGPADSHVYDLDGSVDIPGTLALMEHRLREIERDVPEITLFDQLRQMSQVTGPAASRLMGDVAGRVTESMALYDQQSIKLFAMAVAIGGMRATSGDWGPLSRHQQLFLPFGLDSYQAGDLDFSIDPRPLLPLTTVEALEIEQLRNSVKAAVASTVTANIREAIPG